MNESKKPLVVLVEDDKNYRHEFEGDLKEIIPDAKVETFCCGADFLDAYENCPARIPDIFVIDLMLDWKKPWVETKRPAPEVPFEQGKTAQMCFDAVRAYSQDVPIILWTISDSRPKPGKIDSVRTFFRKKDRDIEGDVFRLIRKILSSRS